MTFDELLGLSDIENVSRGDKEVLEVMRKVFNTLADGEGEGGGDGGGEGEVTPVSETEIFIANYGETTAEEITQAISDGKLCVCLYNGFANGIAWLTTSALGEYYFNKVYGTGWIQYHVAGENWNSTSGQFVSKNNAVLTGTPVVSGVTPPDTDNGDRIATTRFVQRAIAYHLNQLDITGDYDDLDNKPSINGVTLSGNKTTQDLGISVSETQIQNAVDDWLDDHSASIDGLSFEAKNALLALLSHVAYAGANGQQYYTTLENALTEGIVVDSISAVFTQGSTVIYDTDNLDRLKQYLVVTAHYTNNTTATIDDYTLSGTLSIGSSTITVTYSEYSTTFVVTVSSGFLYTPSRGLLSEQSYVTKTVVTAQTSFSESIVDGSLRFYCPSVSSGRFVYSFIPALFSTFCKLKIVFKIIDMSWVVASNVHPGWVKFQTAKDDDSSTASAFGFARTGSTTGTLNLRYEVNNAPVTEAITVNEWHTILIENTSTTQTITLDGTVIANAVSPAAYAASYGVMNAFTFDCGNTNPNDIYINSIELECD